MFVGFPFYPPCACLCVFSYVILCESSVLFLFHFHLQVFFRKIFHWHLKTCQGKWKRFGVYLKINFPIIVCSTMYYLRSSVGLSCMCCKNHITARFEEDFRWYAFYIALIPWYVSPHWLVMLFSRNIKCVAIENCMFAKNERNSQCVGCNKQYS